MDLYHILLILYFIFFVVLCVRNLKWAIYLIIFVLPSYQIRFEAGGLPMTLLEGMILVVFLAWAIKVLKYKKIKALRRIVLNYKYLFIFSGLFLLSAAISIFVGPELRAAAGIWKAYFVEPILFFIVLINVLREGDFKYIFKIFLWQILILGLFGVYQQVTGVFIVNPFWAAAETRRITTVFAYPNALALYLAPIAVLLIRRNFLVAALALVTIYFTGSKGAMFGIAAGIFFYALFDKSYRKYFIALLIIIVLLSVYVVSTGRLDLKGLATVEGGDSVSVRLDMWKETWPMLKESPLFGAGLSGYQSAVAPFHRKEYIEIYLYPHNIFLNFWSEIGLLGLLDFLLIVGWFYYTGFKKKLSTANRQLSVVLMAGMTALLVHGLVDVPYFKNDLSILFWLLVGMMVVLTKVGYNKKHE